MLSQHTILCVLVCCLFLSRQSSLCNSENVLRPKEAPVPTSGQIVRCKQMDCWKKKTFTILQVDDKSDSERQEWNWYTKSYADRHGLSYILQSVAGPPSAAENSVAQKLGWTDTTSRYYFKAMQAGKHIQHTDFLLLMDIDVMVSDFDQDVRCLLEHWGFDCDGKKHSPLFLQSEDPPSNPWNYWEFNSTHKVLNTNTGFIAMRNHTRTKALLDRWAHECAVNSTQWGTMWYWDQGFWNGYVRPHMHPWEHIVLPCDQANGFRWLTNHEPGYGCAGTYVTHAWGHGKIDVAHEMLRRLMLRWTAALESTMNSGASRPNTSLTTLKTRKH